MESDHAEAFGALAYGQQESLLKVLVALVVGQTELIEASVCGRQIAKCWRSCNLEAWIQFLQNDSALNKRFSISSGKST